MTYVTLSIISLHNKLIEARRANRRRAQRVLLSLIWIVEQVEGKEAMPSLFHRVPKTLSLLVLLFLTLISPSLAAFHSKPSNTAFTRNTVAMNSSTSSSVSYGSPRPIHTEFTVEKATPEKMAELGVQSWPTWSTADSEKYKVGIQSQLKVYGTNELSFIISGEVDIIPKSTGIPVTVKKGDFVTFPKGFECYWFVKDVVTKNWFEYE